MERELKNNLISVVSPVYRAENMLEELVVEITENLKKISSEFEIILVDDASPDNSWGKIIDLANKYKHVKGYKLSRNFGQHYAIFAGLTKTEGDWIIVMDCDLQDRPDEISNLYNFVIKNNLDYVKASRFDRQDSFFKKFFSSSFSFFLGYLTGVKQDASVGNFGVYNRKLINAVLQMGDKIKFFPSMVNWVGFNGEKLAVKHSKRKEGKSTYNIKKLFNLGLDIVLSYSEKPMKLMIKSGLLISFLSICFAIYIVFRYLNHQIVVPGYASIIVSIWFFSGFIIFTLGILGLYIGKTFESVKDRPTFIISEWTK